MESRGYVWYALTALKSARTGFQMKGLVESCKDWSKDGKSGKTDCLWGALDTAITLGMLATSGWEIYVAIGLWMAASGSTLPGISKRENGGVQSYVDTYDIQSVQQYISNVTGLPTTTILLVNGSALKNDQTGWPVHASWSHSGTAHLYSLMSINGNITAMRIGGWDKDLQKHDEQFNLENFSSGRIESHCNRVGKNVDSIDANNDFGTLDHQVSCAFDLESHEYIWYLYDFNNKINIGEGTVAAFQYSTYDQDELKNWDLISEDGPSRTCREA